MQEIIKNNEHLLDHSEHFNLVLLELEKAIQASPLPVLEIGTNMGGSSNCFLAVIFKNNKNNPLIGVDPYGSIPYHNGGFQQDSSVYENDRYYSAMKTLYDSAQKLKLTYTHFKATSEYFMAMFPHVKLYSNNLTQTISVFSFIYLDGSHDPEIMKKEILFFKDKFSIDGAIIVDDWEDSRFGPFLGELIKDNPHLEIQRHIQNKIVIKYRKENGN